MKTSKAKEKRNTDLMNKGLKLAWWGTIAGSIAAWGVLVVAIAGLTAILYHQWYKLDEAKNQQNKARKSLLHTQGAYMDKLNSTLDKVMKEERKLAKGPELQKKH